MIANPNITATQTVKPADGELLLWACDQRDPRTLGPGLLNNARNLRYTDGVPETRLGVTKPGWANFTSIGSATISALGTPYGSGVFRDPNGVEWQIVAAGGYVWRTRPGNANVTVPLPTGISIVSPCRFVQAFNVLFCFRGRYLAPLVMSDLNAGFQDILPRYDAVNGGSLGGGIYQAAIVAAGTAADQMAYGPYLAVTSLTWSNGLATAVTTLPHGYVTGSDVTIKGVTQVEFNGRVGITVLDDYTFTFPLTTATTGSPTGTILVSNNIFYWTALGSTATVTTLAQQTEAAFALTSLTSAATFNITAVCSATLSIVSLSHVGTTCTAVITNHGLTTGEVVAISGAAHLAYNNPSATITVVDSNTFTFPSANGSTPGGNENPTSAVCAAPFTLVATASATNHGLTSGETVTIAGANQSAYNGTFVVTVVNANTFTYTMASNPGAAATGTITCTPASSTTATATKAGHGLTTGTTVTISGASPSAYNGTYVVTVTSSSQFTYVFAGGTSPATGTITCTIYAGSGGGTAFGAVATATNHGFSTNDYVTISGASNAVYNGTFVITVTNANTFTYLLPSNPGTETPGGVITAQTSRVLANQTPDSNPAAWARAYDILPNADTALFVNNLLLVPTAYQPASTDNYATITGGAYSTVDFIVATNYLDYVHFEFNDEFRINQGTADAITDLFAFGGNVIVLKEKSFHMLSAVSGDLSGITQTTLSKQYGCTSPRAWTVVGSNAYFLSPGYGVMVIRQTDLGEMLSVNVPLSAPINRTIQQIDWTKSGGFRMTHWDNKLYLAVTLGGGVGPAILVYDFVASVRMGNNVWESGVMTQGWTPMDTGSALNVLEFHELNLNGEPRHFFLSTDGWVNLLEESERGDQVAGNDPQGLGWEEIDSLALTRAYGASLEGQVRPVEECFSLMTLRPNYTVSVVFPGAANTRTLVANVTRSNTVYDRPFTAAPWDASNINDDWATPYRQDYSVSLGAPGPNIVPAGTMWPGYSGHGQMLVQINGFVVGQKYQFTPGTYFGGYPPEIGITTAFVALDTIVLRGAGVFTATQTTYWLGMAQPANPPEPDANTPVTDLIQLASALYLGGNGLVLDQYQESLDTRRISGRQSKNFQLQIENTQGRIRLVGERISSVPGRNRRGILT